MQIKGYLFFVFIIFLTGCSVKQPVVTKSAIITFKTKKFKFNDQGFIEKYDDKVKLTILALGVTESEITIYKDKICKNSISCFDSDRFNEQFLDESYEKDFLYNLFNKEDIDFKDKEHRVFIKVIYNQKEKGEY